MTEIEDTEKPNVQRVCQDYRVREDGVLAQRLQEEEYEQHYVQNRSERKTVRGDIRVAKEAYMEEAKNIVPHEILSSMAEKEDWLAKDLHNKLQTEDEKNDIHRCAQEVQDEEFAKKLHRKETLRQEHLRQKRLEKQRREEQEKQMLLEAVTGLQEEREAQEAVRMNGHSERSSSQGPVHINRCSQAEQAPTSMPASNVQENFGCEPIREYDRSPTYEEEQTRLRSTDQLYVRFPRNDGEDTTVVKLPKTGGRLESDRIILADGTAISLFDNEKEREMAIKKSRVRQDEEFARMLQAEENKLVEQEKLAAHDRKLALEFQDMELAKELQRKEVVRLQKVKRERQLRRAHSAEAGEMQAVRRLPSYDEAVQRNSRLDMPDLLEGEASAVRGSQHYQDEETANVRQRQSSETEGASGYTCYHTSQQHGAVPSSHSSSPPSSQEHSLERSGQSHRSSSTSSYSSSKAETSYMSNQQSSSPCSHEGVWERLCEQGNEVQHSDQPLNRLITRSYTVSTMQPATHDSSDYPALPPISSSRTTFNIAECIDPTYQRHQQQQVVAAPQEGKSTVVPLIQPHRRRSSEKKKRDRDKENCKQQ